MLKQKLILLLALFVVLGGVLFTYTKEDQAQASVLQEWYGTVDSIVDGDTFHVDWDSGYEHPEGKTRIRLVGIDTREIDTNQCYSAAATTRLSELLPIGAPIKMEARDLYSESFGRPLRHVFVGAGFTTNVATVLIDEGLGVPASYVPEPDYKSEYFEAGEDALIAEVGIWEEGVCGGDPGTWPDIDMYVNYDASGDDQTNVNGEYIEITNNGPGSLDMSDWTLRGSARLTGSVATQTIPNGTTVPSGGTYTIYSGVGTDTSTEFYLDQATPWLNNTSDVVYLLDTDLNMRGTQFWPCTSSCGLKESIKISDVQYNAPGDDLSNPNGEWVIIKNTDDHTVNLKNWRIQDNNTNYLFDGGDSLAPGEELRVYVGSGSDSTYEKYWSNSNGILSNSASSSLLYLYNPSSVAVDCYSWSVLASCSQEDTIGRLHVVANANASGSDASNPNGEWVSVVNDSDQSIDISGFSVSTPGHADYVFPGSSVIGANSYLRLRIGSGSDTTYNKYWGKSSGILTNAGDYVTLKDTSGALVEHHVWPCASVYCDALTPIVIDKVNYNAPGDDRFNPNGEWIRVRNISSTTQDFQNWKVRTGPYQIVSVGSRPLEPEETLTIFIGEGSNTSSKMYWDKTQGILYNTGSREVEILSPHRNVSDCYGWGSNDDCTTQNVSPAVDLDANYDAEGSDAANPNGEWIDIENTSSQSINLNGFHIYTDGTRYYFDSGDTIGAGQTLRLRLGNGSDSGLTRYADGNLNPLGNSGDEVELRFDETDQYVKRISW